MEVFKIIFSSAAFLFCMKVSFAQSFNIGDTVDAMINNAWKKAKILKTVPAKPGFFEVQSLNSNSIAGSVIIGRDKIRLQIKVPEIKNATSTLPGEVSLHLGRYELYSGIPTMYLGHIIILADGRYKVAFSSDEDNYEIGAYVFHPETKSIEWKTGMFKNNRWSGKLISSPANGFRIEFNKITYADSN